MYNTLEVVKSMRLRLDGIVRIDEFVFCVRQIFTFSLHLQEHRQNEVSALRDKLNTFEAQARQLEYTVDVLYKCRFDPTNYYCP